jgi:hypothetical protein
VLGLPNKLYSVFSQALSTALLLFWAHVGGFATGVIAAVITAFLVPSNEDAFVSSI